MKFFTEVVDLLLMPWKPYCLIWSLKSGQSGSPWWATGATFTRN